MQFISNRASEDFEGRGGCLFLDQSYATIGPNAVFRQNRAAFEGGCIWQTASTLSIGANMTAIGNNGASNGGFLSSHYFSGPSTATIGANALVENNIVDQGGAEGGAFYARQCTLWIGANFTARGNTATQSGGAIYFDYYSAFPSPEPTFVLEGPSLLYNNSVEDEWGGAIFFSGHVLDLGVNPSFLANRANNGGAVVINANFSIGYMRLIVCLSV